MAALQAGLDAEFVGKGYKVVDWTAATEETAEPMRPQAAVCGLPFSVEHRRSLFYAAHDAQRALRVRARGARRERGRNTATPPWVLFTSRGRQAAA